MTPQSARGLSRSLSEVMENMGRPLSSWIKMKNQRHVPPSRLMIMEKTKNLFEDLKQKEGASAQDFIFQHFILFAFRALFYFMFCIFPMQYSSVTLLVVKS